MPARKPNRAPWRATFNPDRDFQFRRACTVEGVKQPAGARVNKSSFTRRRLRQLYDMRTICYVGDVPGERHERHEKHKIYEGAAAATEAAGSGDTAAAGDTPIPEDWVTLPWNDRRALARLFVPAARDGDEVAAAITAELARRAGVS